MSDRTEATCAWTGEDAPYVDCGDCKHLEECALEATDA